MTDLTDNLILKSFDKDDWLDKNTKSFKELYESNNLDDLFCIIIKNKIPGLTEQFVNKYKIDINNIEFLYDALYSYNMDAIVYLIESKIQLQNLDYNELSLSQIIDNGSVNDFHYILSYCSSFIEPPIKEISIYLNVAIQDCKYYIIKYLIDNYKEKLDTYIKSIDIYYHPSFRCLISTGKWNQLDKEFESTELVLQTFKLDFNYYVENEETTVSNIILNGFMKRGVPIEFYQLLEKYIKLDYQLILDSVIFHKLRSSKNIEPYLNYLLPKVKITIKMVDDQYKQNKWIIDQNKKGVSIYEEYLRLYNMTHIKQINKKNQIMPNNFQINY